MSASLLRAALGVEVQKSVRARVPVVAAILLVGGVVAICVSVTVAVEGGDPDIVAKLGPVVGEGGWDGYLSAALQVTAAAAAGACGILVSWSVGREFAEGTISGLFALPVSRTVLAAAKLIAFAAWTAAVALALIVVLFVAGVCAGLGPLPPNAAEVAARLLVLVLATAAVTLAAAWVATLTRGLLGGIAATVILLASAQVVVFSGGGAWYPPSAPALWAIDPTPSSTITLLIGLGVGGLFAGLTLLSWKRMELDR